jgi:ferredoxin-NADP reductase/nitrite reductase/ring-hydroxylating ferredoxin subunit
MLTPDQRAHWRPICASHDLPPRHVFHGQLYGHEFAVWRADDGFVNVWENRCLHRGVRLSIGMNDGAELKCAYHGWRYANRSAACTYIPAHPADAPARTICNRTFPAIERYGLIWTALVDAPAEMVDAALLEYDPAVTIFVQPVDAARSVIRGVLHKRPADEMAAFRAHNARLTAIRDRVEAEAAKAPAPEPFEAEFRPVSEELAEMPAPTGRKPAFRVKVARKWKAAEEIMAFRLIRLTGELPGHQPGAHIDVHLPNGLIRQYSLTNGPEDVAGYEIAVKREETGEGGSRALHDVVREGDVLAISAPHNNFPLRRDALMTTLIAGGVGATPLIAMAKTLKRAGLHYAFHAFAKSKAHAPLPETLAALGATLHLGLDPEATVAGLETILAASGPKRHVYICGPRPMLDAARRIAKKEGWPDDAIHFEYFGNDAEIDKSSSFEVALARSVLTLQVAPGQTILEAVRATGVDVPSSCEQGACGTCRCGVIEGVPDHQDVYLTDSEKAAGDQMMICVSRARTPRIVLDL